MVVGVLAFSDSAYKSYMETDNHPSKKRAQKQQLAA
jgi:hypothetical protein